jgi:protein O-GlcNAc transferase
LPPYLPGWLSRAIKRPDTRAKSNASDAGVADKLIKAGIEAEARGDQALAEQLFRDAVSADPYSAQAHHNLGLALQARQQLKSAAASYEEALRLDACLPAAHFNLALTRLALDDPDSAEVGFRAALDLKPDFPEASVGLAEALEARGKDFEALAALRTAIGQRELYVGALFNAAVLLRRLGKLDEAEKLLRCIPEDHPEFPNAMTALAAALRDQGRVEEAVTALRRAMTVAPDSWVTQSELLFTLGFSDRVTAEQLFDEHVAAGRRLEAATRSWVGDFSNVPDPGRVLNVGYLSGDFRMHSVAVFTEFLFSLHRRDKVRIYAYSSTPHHDAMTRRIIDAVDVWRDLRGLPDSVVSEAIVSDRIDLLIDLSGHTSGSRVCVLAGRSAPVQMTWLGYINTTGLRNVDYRITDAIADPHGRSEGLHTEKLLRMPSSQWCYRPPAAARSAAPERLGPTSAFTFGALNQFAKVSEAGVNLWIAVLHAAPAARLRVVNVPAGNATARLESRLIEAGIGRDRFDLVERVPHEDYFRQYSLVDACLDSTPYSGGTTTCDALFLGVPVITLVGHRPISRSSASLLHAVGATQWIARTPSEFVSICASLATEGSWPTASRVALRSKMVASPLMDEQRFTVDLEDLYRKAWQTWCNGKATT